MTSTTFFFFFIPILAIILLAANLIFAPHNPYEEKDNVFECGYDSFLGQNRMQFPISFFIFALLFLLFDLEILLVYPYVVSAYTNGIYGLVIMLIFFLALTLGFAFELGKNALIIDSRQMLTLNNNKTASVSYISGLNYKKVYKLFLSNFRPIVLRFKKTDVKSINLKKAFSTQKQLFHPLDKKYIPLAEINRSLDYSFPRDFRKNYMEIVKSKGMYVYLKDGTAIIDASGGAAVSSVGHMNKRIHKALVKQLKTGATYHSPAIFANAVNKEFCKRLIETTHHLMYKAILVSSGSEAIETSIKLAFDHFHEKGDTSRVNIISRRGSYHGNTIGCLSLSGMPNRKKPYLNLLMKKVHWVSSCNPYREKINMSDSEYLKTKVNELEAKFQELGPKTVAFFIMETVVGAAGGCVTPVPGYLKAMRDVCHKHGALIVFDEIMCGMGRAGTGHIHAWQTENVCPDILVIAKGLSNGVVPIAAVLMTKDVADPIINGSGKFINGQTYQDMTLGPTVGKTVIEILTENDNKVLNKSQKMGERLYNNLRKRLLNHPYVGDIRGQGLFYCVEFVSDKETKIPFDFNISQSIADFALKEPYNIAIYPGTNIVDGYNTDFHIISPLLTLTSKEVDLLCDRYCNAVIDYFNKNNL